MNSSWTLFNQKNISLRFLSDENTSNLISNHEFFLQNSQINYWRFEVIYTFKTGKSSSSVDVIRNECPSNGFCSIHPFNGTTKTLFTISCFHWFDKDTIKDYSLYCKLIRNSIIDSLKYSDGNQNRIGQILISISQEKNEINQQMIDKAVLDRIPTTSIFISPLGSQISPQNSSNSFDESMLLEYQKQLIIQANLREYLIKFTLNLTIFSLNSIQLQSTSLARLTQATNQLTPTTLVRQI
jgi:hypothetical protein